MFVVDDPVTRRWPQHLLDSGRLLIGRIADVYGLTRRIDAVAQLATFTSVLQAAIADGYSGIRVAADNTSAIIGRDRRSAWVEWERAADVFMSENPVTGMCGFDRTRIHVTDLEDVPDLHAQLVGS
jgi:hypothetical protein